MTQRLSPPVTRGWRAWGESNSRAWAVEALHRSCTPRLLHQRLLSEGERQVRRELARQVARLQRDAGDLVADVRLTEDRGPDALSARTLDEFDQVILVLGGEDDEVVALVVPVLREFGELAGERESRVGRLRGLVAGTEIPTSDDVELRGCGGLGVVFGGREALGESGHCCPFGVGVDEEDYTHRSLRVNDFLDSQSSWKSCAAFAGSFRLMSRGCIFH